LACVACEGRAEDCGTCDGKGIWELSQCPKKFIDSEIWEAIRFAEFAERGAWPISGGVLDQCQWFVDAEGFISSERARSKAK